jgi:hypothetical protein
MIAVVGAFTTFLVDKRITGPLFWLLIGSCFLCFFTSIFAGGKGVTDARNEGFNGNWTLLAGKGWFNGQAIACIGGLILFGAALLASSKTKEDPTQGALTSMASSIVALTAKVTELAIQQKADEQKLAQLGQTLGARQDAFELDLRKDLPKLERLEKEQSHLEGVEGGLEKTVSDLKIVQGALKDAVRDLQVQTHRRKKNE